ncbi:hypothetical protein BN946_scf184951.g35 [Trametes cinnabarina]|uniref:ubiquitinyl hydrolase 1 n=1 Tax=Pycnoporus cinnabarinus TaxID=5643 RepID=A0A060SMX0_PYCCI|nr:hypothetical protein BN946_scf184951.g35 [Trametes cinnabarina]
MSRIPPSLLYLTIYNPTLKPSTLQPDDEDAEEIAHILFHTAREHAVSRDRVLRQVGLAKAMVNFSEMFNAGVPCENVHSQARRMIMLSPEPDFWIHACYELAKTPRPPPSASKSKESSKSKSKGKEKEQPRPAVLYEYHDGSLHDEALRTHFQRGYEDFKLLYGSFTSVLARLGQEALELQLERFFTVWAWKWDIEDENFGTHLGIPMHPLCDRLTPILKDFGSKLPQELITFALIPPYVIPPRAPRYPAALVRYVLSRIPPPPTPVARNSSAGTTTPPANSTASSKPTAPTTSPSAKQQQESKADESVSAAGSILGMPVLPPMSLGLDMKNLKWTWPGYLTFGKSNAGTKATPNPQTPPVAAVVTPATPDISKEERRGSTAQDTVQSDLSITGSTRETLQVDTASLLEAISTESMGSHTRAASPAPSTLSRSTQLPESGAKGEGASSPEGFSTTSSPVQVPSQSDPKESLASEPKPTQSETSTPRPAHSFLRSIVHLAASTDPLATERKRVMHLTHCGCTIAIVVDVDNALDVDNMACMAAETIESIMKVVADEQIRLKDEQIPSATKILQPKDRYIVAVDEYTTSSTLGFDSRSEHLYNAQQLLHGDYDVTEVFSRGQNPQHWYIGKRGVGTTADGRAVDGEAYLEVSRKETTLTDVDNALAGVRFSVAAYSREGQFSLFTTTTTTNVMLTPPSPSSSPSLTPLDPTNSRKRQRSLSMQSEASSSSPKRSASQDPQSFQTNESLTSANPNPEIDAYMAEQGEDHGQPIDAGASAGWSATQKLEYVEKGMQKDMHVGQTWYIVSRRWFLRWRKAMTGEEDKEGRVEEKDVGPVDNTPLCDQRGEVTSDLIEHVDCEFVPEEVWTKLTEWYGEPKYPLPRKVIARGILQEPQLELRPPAFKVHLLSPTALPGQNLPPREVTVSSTDKIREVRHAFAAAFNPQKAASGQFRVWKIAPNASTDCALFSVDTLRTCGAALLEDSDRTVDDELVDSSEVFVVEFMTRDSWMVDAAQVAPLSADGASQAPPPPTQAGPIFNSGPDFFSQLQQRSAPTVSTTDATSFASSAVTVSKPGPSAKPKVQREPGTLGLGNMGNTCFMNSAIQCLAHTKELMDYFLSGVHQEELNPDNPLGMHGQVALAFAALVSRIWDPELPMSSYTPREFKQTLQRFAPQFSGYQQHDSQELVAFLLDGLHEDLNRVHKKPYVEKPDWEGGGDKELVDLARKSWEGYMMRNDSVVVDLFQGQYQSTLVCPECEKVSITFDPFMYLTLPLPVQKKWRHNVLYVPWDLKKPHIRVPVELDRHSTFKDVRQLLGRWMGANPDNLLTLEVFNHQFYKNLDDTVMCEDMAEGDVIVCFELPCNSQQSRTYKPHPDDPLIVPVFPCESTPARTSYRAGPSLFGYPFITVIDQEQAKDPQAIYDAITDRLQRWSVHARDLSSWEAGSGSSDEMEPVHIPITGPAVVDSVTEIKENGEVVTVEQEVPEEGDIVDEKATVVREADEDVEMGLNSGVPRKLGFKSDLFTIRVQRANAQYAVGYTNFGTTTGRYETLEQRAETSKDGTLLYPNDAVFTEFDDGVKTYFFGDERNSWEFALWNKWDEFVHPELAASRKAASSKKKKGITLQDCLDEFTKEEQLGEDDLWYCPRCKKHQQATKRFDLWKVPDVLVVHLKRFSNSRMLRDKIDTFVDFPIEGLDLTDMVGERLVGKRLAEQGVDVRSLGISDLDEPLVYDLFAVDEHLGGLGGGHYRAYAANHVTGKWYHFDDSYVTPSRPEAAVNANAYLLFYRRRANHPLGGKSYAKVEEIRAHAPEQVVSAPQEDMQLPTPPSEESLSRDDPEVISNPPTVIDWPTPNSMSRSSPASSSPLPLDDRPPPFDEALFDPLIQSSLGELGEIPIGASQLELPDPLSRGSPSSIDAEPDLENDDTDSPFYDVDAEGGDEYDANEDFSRNSVRLRNAVFKRSEPLDDDADGESTDMMMTPAESEMDDTDSAVYEIRWDVDA